MEGPQRSGEASTTEDWIMQMDVGELQELLADMGLEEASRSTAAGVQELVKQLGSLEAAIIAVTDDQVMRRAA